MKVAVYIVFAILLASCGNPGVASRPGSPQDVAARYLAENYPGRVALDIDTSDSELATPDAFRVVRGGRCVSPPRRQRACCTGHATLCVCMRRVPILRISMRWRFRLIRCACSTIGTILTEQWSVDMPVAVFGAGMLCPTACRRTFTTMPCVVPQSALTESCLTM